MDNFKFLVPDDNLVPMSTELHHLIHKDYINQGYDWENYIFDQLMMNNSKETILLIRERKTTFNQIEPSINASLEDDCNYYIPDVEVIVNDDVYNVDAVYIENGIVYFVEEKKTIGLDTTNIRGIYDKLEKVKSSFNSKQWKMKSMIVGFEETPYTIYDNCKLNKTYKDDIDNLELVSGIDFFNRMGIDFYNTLKSVKNIDYLNQKIKKIITKYNV